MQDLLHWLSKRGDGGKPGHMFTTHRSKVNETEAKSRSPASSQKDVREGKL